MWQTLSKCADDKYKNAKFAIWHAGRNVHVPHYKNVFTKTSETCDLVPAPNMRMPNLNLAGVHNSWRATVPPPRYGMTFPPNLKLGNAHARSPGGSPPKKSMGSPNEKSMGSPVKKSMGSPMKKVWGHSATKAWDD